MTGTTSPVRYMVGTVNKTTDKYSLIHTETSAPLTYRELFTGLQQSCALPAALTTALRESRFESYYFESPAFAATTLDTPFEFVCVDAPQHVGMAVNPTDFAEYLHIAEAGVTSFDNLGGDARLVVPLPAEPSALKTQWYSQIATFVRNASDAQTQALWKEVGRTALFLVSKGHSGPRWLSTAGSSVPWLHIRFDSRPKYYRHMPYRLLTAL
jgi:hypothetical protein